MVGLLVSLTLHNLLLCQICLLLLKYFQILPFLMPAQALSLFMICVFVYNLRMRSSLGGVSCVGLVRPAFFKLVKPGTQWVQVIIFGFYSYI